MEELAPKISVIMPVYNAADFLRESIASVLGQTENDFEFIIINDGSTDSTVEIVKSFVDNRIRFFNNQHTGLIKTLNFGLTKARGEFIARFDADDLCMASRFREQLNFFEEHPENVLVGSWAELIDNSGKYTGKLTYPPESWKQIKKYSLLHNPFIHSTIMFRRDLIRLVGNYHTTFKHAEDYEFWTRIIYRYPCANIPQRLIKYRVHKKQVTRKSNLPMRITGIFARILALKRFILSFK